MFELRGVTFSYGDRPVLDRVDLAVNHGELMLLAGPTGVGKSTLLGVVAGLVPAFTGGTLTGDVLVDGESVLEVPARDRAHVVGFVGQNPPAWFVTDTVEEELAFGMEQLGLAAPTMRRRVEETLDLLGIADLRHRDLRTLSGGQQQRVAIGSVLTTHPRLLVLDEPTSALDPTAAEDVLATLTRLVHDLDVSVLVAEHRLERVVPFADRMCLLDRGGTVRVGDPADLLVDAPIAPPLVELGRLAGWSPLPLTVRDARRRSGALVSRLAALAPQPAAAGGSVAPQPAAAGGSVAPQPAAAGGSVAPQPAAAGGSVAPQPAAAGGSVAPQPAAAGGSVAPQPAAAGGSVARQPAAPAPPVVEVRGRPRPSLETTVDARKLWVAHGSVPVLRDVGLALAPGTVTALMGRNGAGKSTLLWTLQGRYAATRGSVRVAGADPHLLRPDARREHTGLVPQSPADLLYLESVAEECAAADRTASAPADTCAALLERLAPGIDPAEHPRDLSEGQRLALAVAIVLTAGPPVLLLDEPTRGLDYPGKRSLAGILRDLAAGGRAILVATHDVEFAAQVADEVVVLAEGEVVSSGPVREVVAESPAFAPQVTKVLGPGWLRVDEVAAALASGPTSAEVRT